MPSKGLKTMKGFETQLLQFMTGADNRFAIPVYQRKYDWRIENCKQLYDDLLKVVKNHRNNHFFGSIVSEYNPDGYKNEIEQKLSQCLIWDRGGDNKYARIYLINEDVSIENTNDWNAMAEFHAKWSSSFIDTIVPILKKELNLDIS